MVLLNATNVLPSNVTMVTTVLPSNVTMVTNVPPSNATVGASVLVLYYTMVIVSSLRYNWF